MAEDGQGEKKKSGVLRDLVQVESMIQVALGIPIGCVLGWAAGDWADKHFHTSWIVIVGILLGAAGGFAQMFAVLSKMMKKGDR